MTIAHRIKRSDNRKPPVDGYFAYIHTDNESIVEFIISEIDRDLKKLTKINDHPNYDELKEEGEKLKEQVQRTGSASASSIFIVGKK